MDEEATFEALREILPELEEKLRTAIEEEYKEELRRVHLCYQQTIEEALKNQEEEIKQEAERNQNQLRKQLSLIQRERQKWIILQSNYKKTIMELTGKAKEKKGTSDLSALTQIIPQNVDTEDDRSKVVNQAWKKKSQSKQYNLPIPVAKKNENNKFNSTLQRNLFEEDRDDQNLLEERPLHMGQIDQGKIKTWKTSKQLLSSNEQFRERGRRQDTMVLSPPKSEQIMQMKASVLQPPQQQPSSLKSSIFWNEDGKKKLLSMIRNIK